MENIFQYIWKFKFAGTDFTLQNGQKIIVLDPGVLNRDAGPDFFNAKIIFDKTEWIGNVEIHVKSSDWFRHKHDLDKNYDSVILHVVNQYDCDVFRSDGSLIPTLVLNSSPTLINFISSLTQNINNVRCQSQIHRLSEISKRDWIDALAIERLQKKAQGILNTYSYFNSDWEQTCFITLARSLGFGLNSDPFEQIAKTIPLRILHHHSDNPIQLEAIIFGQAGLLDPSTEIFNEYYQFLCREYYFLARKYSLRPSDPHLLKMARTRPQNFPHRRLAYLASTASGGFALMKKILDSPADINFLSDIFNFKTTDYWANHYSFNDKTAASMISISRGSLDILLINTAAPLLYAYGSLIDEQKYIDKALFIMESLPPENNAIVRGWNVAGIKATSALESQALLHLRKEYCDNKKCLRCRFGHKLLKSVICDPEGIYGNA